MAITKHSFLNILHLIPYKGLVEEAGVPSIVQINHFDTPPAERFSHLGAQQVLWVQMEDCYTVRQKTGQSRRYQGQGREHVKKLMQPDMC